MNEFFDWVIEYGIEKPRYQLFDVWDRPELASDTQRFVNSSVCSTFSEHCLAFLSGRPGAAFRKTALLYRNYIPLLSEEAPTVVDESDEQAMAEVVEFYRSMTDAVTMNESLPNFLESVAQKTRVFFVFADGKYLRVKMRAPYIVLSALYQPMHTSWTETEAIPASSMQPHARTGHEIFRVGEALNGAAQMLMSRAPEMLSRRAQNFSANLTGAALGSGGAVAVFSLMTYVLGLKTMATLTVGFTSGCFFTLCIVAYRRFASAQ